MAFSNLIPINMRKDVFQVLQAFVPVFYQLTAKNFIYYLKTMNERRYDIALHSLDVKANGIDVLSYLPRNTKQEFFKWSDIEKIINQNMCGTLPDHVKQNYQIAFDL